jgi:hypothetical protein
MPPEQSEKTNPTSVRSLHLEGVPTTRLDGSEAVQTYRLSGPTRANCHRMQCAPARAAGCLRHTPARWRVPQPLAFVRRHYCGMGTCVMVVLNCGMGTTSDGEIPLVAEGLVSVTSTTPVGSSTIATCAPALVPKADRRTPAQQPGYRLLAIFC